MHYEVRTPDHFFTHFSAKTRAEAEKKVLELILSRKEMTNRAQSLLENHIKELRSIAAILRAGKDKFKLERSAEIISKADEAEVYLILNKGK